MHEFRPKWGPRSVSFSIFVNFCQFLSIFVAIFGKVGTLLLKVMLAGEDFSKRLLNDPSEIAERSRDHSRDTLAISAAILEQRII